MTTAEHYKLLAISLGLGLLIGLQRQWRESELAGIRTFPLITLLGTLSVLASGGISWLSAVGLLGLTALLSIANLNRSRTRGATVDDDDQFGLTTEVAVLLMYVVGCSLGVGMIGASIVTSGVAAVLLHWKDRLHGIVESLSSTDLKAVMTLALIGLIILPILPDETYGPYDVLNPYGVWRMVVLIVGISMTAYVAYKLLGTKVGLILGGILGGLISSTATTVSYARQTRSARELSMLAALVILIASTIVNVRVLIEIAVVAPALLRVALLPLTVMLILMLLECIVLYLPLRKLAAEPPEHDNPAQLKPAIFFGALYALILFVVAATKDIFGEQALYWIAGVSGLTDVDAITLSTAKMFNQGRVNPETAWRVILVATMSNLVFKAGAVAVLGSRKLLAYVILTFGIAFGGGVCLLVFWPNVDASFILSWWQD